MKEFFVIILSMIYICCSAQTLARNYNIFFTRDGDAEYRNISESDSELLFHPYYDTTLICILKKNGHPFEVRDANFNLVEIGNIISDVCMRRSYRDKLWKEFYKNGNIKAVGNYRRNDKINSWKYFYPNGKLMRFENYPYDNNYKFSFDNPYYLSEPFLIAEYEYYENGQLKMEGQYDVVNNCKDSVYEIDLNTGMEKDNKIEVEFSCSVKCGTWNYYFPDGSLMKKEEY